MLLRAVQCGHLDNFFENIHHGVNYIATVHLHSPNLSPAAPLTDALSVCTVSAPFFDSQQWETRLKSQEPGEA